MIDLESPTIARLPECPNQEARLAAALTYKDGKIDHELSRLKKRKYSLVQWYGQTEYSRRLKELESQRTKCLLFRDSDGLYTYSGLADKVADFLGQDIKVAFKVPAPDSIPWKTKPKHSMREYQQEACERLLQHRHAAVEICTGGGKSRIILEISKRLALPTVIMVPSKSIAGQIYQDFKTAFGTQYVGMFGDGKKQLGKVFTIAIGASLTRIEPKSKEWDWFSKCKVFISDESHNTPAATLEKVCFGLMARAPYRFFFSATQLRNDGLDLLLEAITGPVVYRLTVEDCVRLGYLASPRFYVMNVEHHRSTPKDDPNDLTRFHLFYNETVNRIAADYANKFVELLKRPTLILIDEVEQFRHLYQHLKHKAKFAHGPLGENKDKVPKEFWNVDVDQLVQDFNAGDIPILVGTSCISTGTDLKVAEACIYLQGGKSEIQVKQAIGRGTRGGSKGGVINPWTGEIKKDCIILDFDVVDNSLVHRHAEERRDIYRSILPPIKEIYP